CWGERAVDGELAGYLGGVGGGGRAGDSGEADGGAGEALVVGGVDESYVVDAGRPGGRGRWLLGAGFGVGVPADDVRDGLPGGASPPADLDAGEVKGVEDQLDLAGGQGGIDLVGVAVQRHGRGLADGAPLAPQERLVQLGGVWH